MKYLWELDESTQNVVIHNFLRTWTNQNLNYENCIIEEISGGFHSRIFRVTYYDFGERSYCMKVPTTSNIKNNNNAADSFDKIAFELEKTTQLSNSPFSHTFGDVLVCCGWPVFKSAWRDGTLRTIVNGRVSVDDFDKILSVFQVILALRDAKALDISPHQDLKPENIFFERIDEGKFHDYDGDGLRVHCRLADFALANAFKEMGHPFGSRPYQAPEQYSKDDIKPDFSEKVDVFALGVILYELATDGLHPRGEKTEDIWPLDDGKPLSKRDKFKRSANWKKWALSDKRIDRKKFVRFEEFHHLIAKSIDADPSKRPTLSEFGEEVSGFLKSSWPQRFNIAKQQIKFWQKSLQLDISAATGKNAGPDHLIKHVKSLRDAATHLRSF